jgi:hypothetical protein
LKALKTVLFKALQQASGQLVKLSYWLKSTKKKVGVIVAEKWIQKAIKKPGALKKALGVKEGEKIPAKKLSAAAKKPGKMGQRARLAQTLGKLKK